MAAKEVVALRLDDVDIKWLDRAAEIVLQNTGQEVTRTWVMLELMKTGRDAFEVRFPNQGKKNYFSKGMRSI